MKKSVLVLLPAFFWLSVSPAAAEEPLQVGFAKVEITPREKVRLVGYAVRKEPTDRVVQPLWARAMVVRPRDGRLRALVTLDLVGVPGELTRRVARVTQRRWGIGRSQLVLSTTHTHTGPALEGMLTNHLIRPPTAEEAAARARYTKQVEEAIVQAIARAVEALRPARWELAHTRATFAVNRRIVENGRWVRNGVNRNGPVDHSVPVLAVRDEKGKLLGVVFGYACHATTLGPKDNFICGDWPGYACQFLEERHPGAVALCVIGCGADANPHPRPGLQLAQAHGRSLADQVDRLLGRREGWTALPPEVMSSFGFAGLPFDRPSRQELLKRLKSSDVRTARHAAAMLKVWARKGRLPETYPCPVHVWRVGPLTWVFLGGEVVVDYALRLKKELPGVPWISAYCDDVFAYVASRRVIAEGGYEADYSMLNYNQPGPWLPEAEDVLVRRVHQLLKPNREHDPTPPQQALKTFQLPPDLELQLAAAEPLVEDPVCLAFDAQLRLWVLEMRDYPTGVDGRPGGRVKILTDTDGDGRYDRAVVFLDNLSYPSGLLPWGRGAFVIDAPELFFAEDTDGDGRADRRQVLFRGFQDHNPQHQASSLQLGLDNWIYGGFGPPRQRVTVLATGRQVQAGQDDFRFSPDGKTFQLVTGRTQYGRTQSDWGQWFGSTNPNPFWHFIMPRRYLERNPAVAVTQVRRSITRPPSLPPVYPRSRTEDRFNDLFALNRFTSACGAHVYGDVALGPGYQGHIFACEPVHNLVHRAVLVPQGVTFQARRVPQEQQSEFLASTDLWSRPVWITTGPDGALWVADMYRRYIEHPQWIPDGWLAQIDVRAGEGLGRIYRIVPRGKTLRMPRPSASLKPAELVEELTSTNRWRRLMAQWLLVQGGHRQVVPQVKKLLRTAKLPQGRLHALWTLQGLGALEPDDLAVALHDAHPEVVRHAVRLSEPYLDREPKLFGRVVELAASSHPGVVFQVVFSLGESQQAEAAAALVQIARKHSGDVWIRQAVFTSLGPHAAEVARRLLRRGEERTQALLEAALDTLGRSGRAEPLARLVAEVAQPNFSVPQELWRVEALVRLLPAIQRRRQVWLQVLGHDQGRLQEQLGRFLARVLGLAADSQRPLSVRQKALGLLGLLPAHRPRQRELLLELLQPQQPPGLQQAALEALARLEPKEFPGLVFQRWGQLTPRLHELALQRLLQRREWIVALLEARAKGKLGTLRLSAQARDALLRHPQAEIRRRAEELFAHPSRGELARLLDRYGRRVAQGGNPLQGALVFQRVCATCHQYRGLGRSLGPKLDQLSGQKRSAEFLLESILDPNAAVESKFVGYSLLLADGRVLQGLIVEENATAIQLADAQGKLHTVLRADVEQLAATGKSFMPEGLHRDLTPEQAAHLIAFLRLDLLPPEQRLKRLPGWVASVSEEPGGRWRLARGRPSAQVQLGTAVLPALGSGGPVVLEAPGAARAEKRLVWAVLLARPKQAGKVPLELELVEPKQGRLELTLGPDGSVQSTADGRATAAVFPVAETGGKQLAVLLVVQQLEQKPRLPGRVTLRAASGSGVQLVVVQGEGVQGQ